MKSRTEESELKNLLECAYILLLIDQHNEGLWGRSITPETKEPYVSSEETRTSKRQQRAESLTATFMAVDAIYTFTKDPTNRYIERSLHCLPNHEENSGYGSFGGQISSYPIPKYQVIVNCRHTATALLMYLLFQDRIDEKIIRGVKFLIEHIKKDGGWGITVDPSKQDSECITTTYVLKLLDTVNKTGINENYTFRLDEAINKGLGWLEQSNKQNNGFWVYPGLEHMKVRDSAGILATLYELTTSYGLKNYKKELYNKNLQTIASLQNDDDGWPLSLEGRSEISSTIWVVHALINSRQDRYKDSIENGISFIMQNIYKRAYQKTCTSTEWSMILKLCRYKNIQLSHERDNEIQKLANAINNEAFETGDINIVRKKLPRQFKRLEAPILGILEKCRPTIAQRNFIEKMIDRTPRWLKWVVGVILTVVGILLSIFGVLK